MTSSPETIESEPPECPVCLQPYNSSDTIPRVLACGHSSCEVCLTQLPRPPSLSSAVIRCPVCTQLVKFSNPTTLPKNIDLLRYSLSSPKPDNPKPLIKSTPRRHLVPETCLPELYAAWKDWLIPNGAVLIDTQAGFGRIKIDLGLSVIAKCRLVDDQKVGLVEIGRFEVGHECLFEYSYVTKVMSVVGCMSDGQRTELGTLLGLSLRQPRVCGVLGLWLDVESGLLCLVTERKNDGVLSLGDLRDGFDQENQGWMRFLSMIGVELCEAFVGLRSEWLVCGCLGLSCLCFDEFGHVYIDPGEVLLTGRKIYQCVLEGLNGKRRIEASELTPLVMDLLNRDVFISPEVLFELLHREGIETESIGVNSKVDYSSDVWLFACVLLRLITGKQFAEGMHNYWMAVAERGGVSDWEILYLQWVEMMKAALEASVGSEYPSLQGALMKCLDLDPANRPLISDVWKTISGPNACHCSGHVSRLNRVSTKDNAIQCLVLGELCYISSDLSQESTISGLHGGEDNHEAGATQVREMRVATVVEGFSASKMHCKDLQGHLDCVTGFCVGGFCACTNI
uniref:RING-type domain-containing protein n=1 Tax=Opuntia streptacantha TaxID=393608 RepID=A0A7C9ECC3_OPUST